MTGKKKKALLALEFIAIFGGIPLLVLYFKSRLLMILVLWGGAAAVYLAISRADGFRFLKEWNWSEVPKGMPQVMLHFLIAAPAMAVFTFWNDPQSFLSFSFQRTQTWLAVMILYPLLSVAPQEIIYRSFLFHRYGQHAGNGWFAVILSALSFGYMHVIFANGVALILSTAGGFLMARTYEKHRSLALVCIEHALYGCLVFTIGLGVYFYSGAAWR
jgi:membrane protease YdiL (CAAX protease family)